MAKEKLNSTTVTVPEMEKRLAELSLSCYCEERVPAHMRDKVRLTYRWRGNTVTIFEERPEFLDRNQWTSCPVAQFRYEALYKRWILYCADRNSRWHLYDEAEPAKSLQTLLEEVEADPTGIFWG